MAFSKKLISPSSLLGILLLGSFGFSAYTYYLYRTSFGEFQRIKTDPTVARQAVEGEAKSLVDEIGKIAVLPEGTPTVATVTDAEKLKKDQTFFRSAENGYKILVYEKKAYLYDPNQKKIIEIAPVRPAAAAAAASSPTLNSSQSPKLKPEPQ